ncbi:MAG: alanine racemase [Nitrospirota bacterium]|nr:MAG: alanine racemase [Nitrospirota bacterium]
MNRRSVADINLDSLVSNYYKVREMVGDSKIIPVIKADAYGHGDIQVARRLEKEDVFAFGVAYVDEAIALREAGIRSEIIVFFDNERLDDLFKYRLTPVIFEKDTIKGLIEASRRNGRPIDVHIKVDTGMGRLGFLPEDFPEIAIEADDNREINVVGLMSHFSDADLDDRGYARLQLERFGAIADDLTKRGMKFDSHICNSAGIISFPESHLSAVRPGLMLYGYAPVDGSDGLKPVMKVRSSLVSLRSVPEGTPVSYGRTFVTKKKSTIGVVPVGYADGYSRSFSNRASVIIGGKKAPVVGRVCMDLTMVDVSDIEGVGIGDEVVLLSDVPEDRLSAGELSGLASTIPYEIMTSLGSRAERMYTGEAGP